KRLSFNAKGSVKLGEKLNVSSNVTFFEDHTENVANESTMFGRLLQVPPTVKFHFEDGSITPFLPGNRGNPLYNQQVNTGKSEVGDLSINLGAKWDILSN